MADINLGDTPVKTYLGEQRVMLGNPLLDKVNEADTEVKAALLAEEEEEKEEPEPPTILKPIETTVLQSIDFVTLEQLYHMRESGQLEPDRLYAAPIGEGSGVDIIITSRTPTDYEIAEIPHNTLIVVYSVDDTGSRFGESAFQTAQRITGFKGTETEWVDNLHGDDGENAFQIAQRVAAFKGTENDWVDSLHGMSAFQVAQQEGFTGTAGEYNSILANLGHLPNLLNTVTGR